MNSYRFSILAALIALLVSIAASVNAGENRRMVAVSGEAVVDVVPDRVSFTLSLESRAKTVAEAYKEAEARTSEALGLLRMLDIPRHQVLAMQLSIQPVIDYKNNRKVVAHKARRNIEVTVDDMDTYARAMDKLGSIDSLRFGGVRLFSSAEAELRLEALETAFDRAREKARVLAIASGQKLGEALRISEASGPSVRYAESGMVRVAASDESDIEPGTVGIRASVSVEFELY